MFRSISLLTIFVFMFTLTTPAFSMFFQSFSGIIIFFLQATSLA